MCVILLLIGAAHASHSPTLAAATLPAAGDDDNLWLLRPDPQRQGFKVLHRRTRDDLPTLHHLAWVRGRVVPGGMASADDRLWLVYDGTKSQPNMAVQSIRATGFAPDLMTDQWQDEPLRFERALPRGVFLRSFTASRYGPWALVRVEDAATVLQIDAIAPPPAGSESGAGVKADPVAPGPVADGVEAQGASSPSGASPRRPIREDRLLQLQGDQWVKMDLPADWPQDTRCWLIVRHPTDRYPMLVALTPDHNSWVVWVYEYKDDGWQRQHYKAPADQLATPVDQALADTNHLDTRMPVLLVVDNQLVMGLASGQANRISVDLWVFRPGAIAPLGTLAVDAPPARPWALVPYSQTIALLATDAQDRLVWSRMDLQARVTPSSVLPEFSPRSLTHAADFLIWVAGVVVTMLVMFIFWVQEPSRNQLKLPHGVAIADLGWRVIASVIDMLPAVLAAVVMFRIDPRELYNAWPGRSGDWHTMLPSVTVIGVFVLHTTLTELFTGKTIGKAVTAMRVTTLDGKPPHIWQVLARNFTKALDLIVLLTLIVPMVTPHGQRLGDLMARTVVVTAKKQKAEPT